MKIAIISDIHSNLEALRETVNELEERKIDDMICLGDVVGYGASPNECIDLLREKNIPALAGNHDKGVTGEIDIGDFSEMARAGVLWTRKVITDENLGFLSALPYTINRSGLLFVHSSPDFPERFRYLFEPSDAEVSFDYFSESFCFIGHTHRPVVFCDDGSAERIVRGRRYIINAGSVGQPRDGDRRSCSVIFDTETLELEYCRLEYDVLTARQKILDAGLPKKLGDRLLIGV